MNKLTVPSILTLAVVLSACGGGDPVDTGSMSQTQRSMAATTGATPLRIVTLSGKRDNYTVAWTSTGGVRIMDNVGQDGDREVTAPDRIVFSDRGIALDLEGSAGQAYRVYQAAFDRTPDAAGLGFWIAQMDNGLMLESVAEAFVASNEFTTKYGANPRTSDLVSQFYANVLHRAPDPGGHAHWVGVLDRKDASVAAVLAAFSSSPENKEQVAAAIANGIVYDIYKPQQPLSQLTVETLAACPAANAVQSPDFYQCMVGTIRGRTMFGNAECTLSIARDGVMTLTTDSVTRTLQAPYRFPVYSKVEIDTRDTFFMVASASDSAFNLADLKFTSPKYAAMAPGLSAGVQADIGGLSCQFAL